MKIKLTLVLLVSLMSQLQDSFILGFILLLLLLFIYLAEFSLIKLELKNKCAKRAQLSGPLSYKSFDILICSSELFVLNIPCVWKYGSFYCISSS